MIGLWLRQLLCQSKGIFEDSYSDMSTHYLFVALFVCLSLVSSLQYSFCAVDLMQLFVKS